MDRRRSRFTTSGTLGGTVSSGNAINPLGWVLGNSNLAGDQVTRATVWIDGMQFDLGTLGGANSVIDWPVHNNRGVISGFAETAEVDKLGEAWSCSAFFPQPRLCTSASAFVILKGP